MHNFKAECDLVAKNLLGIARGTVHVFQALQSVHMHTTFVVDMNCAACTCIKMQVVQYIERSRKLHGDSIAEVDSRWW